MLCDVTLLSFIFTLYVMTIVVVVVMRLYCLFQTLWMRNAGGDSLLQFLKTMYKQVGLLVTAFTEINLSDLLPCRDCVVKRCSFNA